MHEDPARGCESPAAWQYLAAVARARIERDSVTFGPDHDESREFPRLLYLLQRFFYEFTIRNQRARAFFFGLKPSRLRMALVALFFRRIYMEINNDRLERILGTIDDGAEIPEVGGLEQYRGPQGVVEHVRAWRESFGDAKWDPERFVDTGTGQVLIEIGLRGQGSSSGITVGDRIFHVWTVRNGMAVRGEQFYDGDEAYVAAGLREQVRGDQLV